MSVEPTTSKTNCEIAGANAADYFRDKSQTKKTTTTTNLEEEHDDKLGEEDYDDRWNPGYALRIHARLILSLSIYNINWVHTSMLE